MQSSDRTEFEESLAMLCAAYNVPKTEARSAAYWLGLEKMSLLQFVRCIEYQLGENGNFKMPTISDIWQIPKKLRAGGAVISQAQEAEKSPDHLHYFANRLLLTHVFSRQGLGAELPACQKLKLELVEFFCGLIAENDSEATPRGFITRWVSGLKRVSPPTAQALSKYRQAAKHPAASNRFAQFMGRAGVQP
jgi:hypothetical protein